MCLLNAQIQACPWLLWTQCGTVESITGKLAMAVHGRESPGHTHM